MTSPSEAVELFLELIRNGCTDAELEEARRQAEKAAADEDDTKNEHGAHD